MKKILLFSASFLAIALVAFCLPDYKAAIIGSVSLAHFLPVSLGNSENIERMALNPKGGFSNFDDDDYDDMDDSNPALYTVNIVNSGADAEFYLFNGVLLNGFLMNGQVIPALTVTAGLTVPQLIFNSPTGQIIQGSAKAIGAAIGDPYTLTTTGTPFSMNTWLSHALNSKKYQVISGIRIDSSAISNHSANITVGKSNPYQDLGSQTVNITSHRKPTDFQATVSLLPLGIALKNDTYVKMFSAAGSTMTLTLLMNGKQI